MRILDKLFGGKKREEKGPMPTRKLNFQFEMTPENGLNFANQFRAAVKSNDNIDLDYSVETLIFVDKFLQRFRDEGLTVNDFAETIFVSGFYVGQVMIQNNQGQWIKQEDAGLPAGITMMPLVVKLPNGAIIDPIAKAFKRFYNGDEDNIVYFHKVSTEQ